MPKNKQTCDCNIIHEGAVQDTLKNMPGSEEFDRIADFFKILGDPTRCRIIYALTKNELCVCDLSNILSMSKSSVSHQLAKMKEYGAVKARREGKEMFYSLDDGHVAEIFVTTQAHIDHKNKGENCRED